MITLLDNIIIESKRLSAKLEEAQKNDNFTMSASTNGVAYGSLSGAIMALVKNEAEYNTLVQQIATEIAMQKRPQKYMKDAFKV